MSGTRYLLFYRQNDICNKLFDELNKTPELKPLIALQNYDTYIEMLKENNQPKPDWLKGVPMLYDQSSGRPWSGSNAILGQVNELLREIRQGSAQQQSTYNPPQMQQQSQQPIYNPPMQQQQQPNYNTSMMQQQPNYNQPMHQQPNYTPPMMQQPTYTPPVMQQPSYNPPVMQQPSYVPPMMQQQPSYNPPVTQQPSYNPPVMQQPSYNPPMMQQQPSYVPPMMQQQPSYTPPVMQQQPNFHQPQSQPNFTENMSQPTQRMDFPTRSAAGSSWQPNSSNAKQQASNITSSSASFSPFQGGSGKSNQPSSTKQPELLPYCESGMNKRSLCVPINDQDEVGSRYLYSFKSKSDSEKEAMKSQVETAYHQAHGTMPMAIGRSAPSGQQQQQGFDPSRGDFKYPQGGFDQNQNQPRSDFMFPAQQQHQQQPQQHPPQAQQQQYFNGQQVVYAQPPIVQQL